MALFTAVGPFQLPAPRSGTLSRIISGTLRSVQTVSDVYLKRIGSLDTSTSGALRVLTNTDTLLESSINARGYTIKQNVT